VASFDDVPLATVVTPPLTSVHQPLYELGATAADLLLGRLEHPGGEPPTTHLRLPTHLVVRQSTVGSSAAEPAAVSSS
jgi:LacI family transcriptional regulator